VNVAKKKTGVKAEFEINDPEDDKNWNPAWGDFIYKISNFPGRKAFEVHLNKDEAFRMSTDVPISSIIVDGSIGFDQMTLYFGDFGHVHLSLEEAEKFYEGVGKVYNSLKNVKVP
jgi:hypothetical protein